MATSQAQAEPKAADPKVHDLTGKLCVFKMPGDVPPRRWFVVDVPFSLARKILKVEPYNPALNKGEQRPRIDSHVRVLKKAHVTGEYTPAPWSAAIRDSHLKNLDINEKTGRVILKVSERLPLSLIDGGHRKETLEDLRKDATGDKEKMAAVDALTITVIIYLDPEYIRRDFRHLQEGLRVNKSQTKFMMQADGDIDPKKKPFVVIASRTAVALNRSDDSFLKDQVKFASGEIAPVEYSSITAPGGSDMATSLYGGARIVWQERFRPLIPDEQAGWKFLVECQNAAWQAIWKYGESAEIKDEFDGTTKKFPVVLMDGRILRPTKMKGPKAGTSLLIMLGNMLAYRMLAIEKRTEIAPRDQKKLVDSVTQILDIEMYGGGSGTVKREVTGLFVRDYFADVVRKGPQDEHDKKKVDAVDGVPIELCDVVLTRSTLNVNKDAMEYLAGEDVKKKPAVERPDPKDTDPNWTDDPVLATEEEDAPDMVPDFETGEGEGEGENEEEFTPAPPGRDAKPVKVSNKNSKAIAGMG